MRFSIFRKDADLEILFARFFNKQYQFDAVIRTDKDIKQNKAKCSFPDTDPMFGLMLTTSNRKWVNKSTNL